MAVLENPHAGSARAIGMWGTAARLVVGGYMVASVTYGSLTGDGTFRPGSWLLGLVGFPALLLSWQAWRARRNPGRLVAGTGPLGHLLTLAVFLALYTGRSTPDDRPHDAPGMRKTPADQGFLFSCEDRI